MGNNIKNIFDIYKAIKLEYKERFTCRSLTADEVGDLCGEIDGLPFEIKYSYGYGLKIITCRGLADELAPIVFEAVCIDYSVYENAVNKYDKEHYGGTQRRQ